MPQLIQINASTFKVDFGNNFEAIIGNEDVLAAFVPHVVFKRKGNGLLNDKKMSFYYPGTQGLYTWDNVNNKLGYAISSDERIEFIPHDPTPEYPEGSVEVSHILNKKPNPQDTSITYKLETEDFDFQKILPLDEEYDQARCIEDFAPFTAPFTITPTEIRDSTGELMKSRPESNIKSYLGKAKKATDIPHDYGEITADTPNKGKHLFYHKVSRTHAHLKRRKLKDALDNEAWVEDMNYDPVTGDITFTLPADFLKNAEYPVRESIGVDPAYTEEMASWQSSTDGSWIQIESDLRFGVDMTSSNVWEVMLENQQKGTENLIGVREYGSSLSRYVNLHEAEPTGGGAGDTHCRMFVQGEYVSGTRSRIGGYTEDASDCMFYLLGYWENVSFTEDWTSVKGSGIGSWTDFAGTWQAEQVHQVIALNGLGSDGQDTACTMGVRSGSSSLSRYFLLHESETGGSSCIDFLVKADADGDVQGYRSGNQYYDFYNAGYFSSELDFVETFDQYYRSSSGWGQIDVSASLDEDGRICDLLCIHKVITANVQLGVRDGDDSSTARFLYEHEAEDNGTNTQELSGFSMSAASNSTGQIYMLGDSVYYGASYQFYYLTGYFKPAVAGEHTTKTQTAKARILANINKSGTAKARILKSFAKTGTAKARISIHTSKTAASIVARILLNYEKTAGSVVARIQKAYSKTGTAKASIWSQSVEKTQTALARILKAYEKTSGSVVARILTNTEKTGTVKAYMVNSYEKTMTSLARILVNYEKTGTAKAFIWSQSFEKTMTSLARILKSYAKTSVSLARMLLNYEKTTTALARMLANIEKTTTAKANIILHFAKSGTALARILVNYAKTTTAKARILLNYEKTGTAKANIASADHYTKTSTTLARILKSFSKSGTVLARMLQNYEKTATAKASIILHFAKTGIAQARILISSSKSGTALARIEVRFSKTETSIARILVSYAKTGLAKAYLVIHSAKTGIAQARVQARLAKTSSAKANIIPSYVEGQLLDVIIWAKPYHDVTVWAKPYHDVEVEARPYHDVEVYAGGG